MKRYNWEYNGEKMGLIERKDGVCVLWSDVQPLLNQDIIALRSELEAAKEENEYYKTGSHYRAWQREKQRAEQAEAKIKAKDSIIKTYKESSILSGILVENREERINELEDAIGYYLSIPIDTEDSMSALAKLSIIYHKGGN